MASVSQALFRESIHRELNQRFPTQEAFVAFLDGVGNVEDVVLARLSQHQKNVLPASADKLMTMFGTWLSSLSKSSAITLGSAAGSAVTTPAVAIYGAYHYTKSSDTVMDTAQDAKERLEEGIKFVADTSQSIALGLENKVNEYVSSVYMYLIGGLVVIGLAGSVDLKSLTRDMFRAVTSTKRKGGITEPRNTKKVKK